MGFTFMLGLASLPAISSKSYFMIPTLIATFTEHNHLFYKYQDLETNDFKPIKIRSKKKKSNKIHPINNSNSATHPERQLSPVLIQD